MSNVTIDIAGLTMLATRLATIGVNLRAELAVTNAAIVGQTEELVTQLYGSKLDKYWLVLDDVVPEALASIEAFTDENKVLWWEYGTPPHLIVATTGRFLRFIGSRGDVVFRREVHHPGEHAHNSRFALQIGMQMIAETEWIAAVQALFAAL